MLADVGGEAQVERLREPAVRDVGRGVEKECDGALPWRGTMLTDQEFRRNPAQRRSERLRPACDPRALGAVLLPATRFGDDRRVEPPARFELVAANRPAPAQRDVGFVLAGGPFCRLPGEVVGVAWSGDRRRSTSGSSRD